MCTHRSKLQFDGFVASGSVSHKYAAILLLLLRLRQACDHPFLVLGRGSSEAHAALSSVSTADDDIAPVPTPDDSSVEFFKTLYKVFIGSVAGGKPGPQMPAPEMSLADLSQAATPHVREVIETLRVSGSGSQECPVCMDPPVRSY